LSHFDNVTQVVGLTASPGVGQASNKQLAIDHILELCANLAATKLSMVKQKENIEELVRHINKPNDS
jgi:hypothetical protein